MQPATHKPLFRLTEVPYFVAADHRHKKIVVAIRGTLSLADALTDLAAKPVPLANDPGRQKVIFLRKVSLKLTKPYPTPLQITPEIWRAWRRTVGW